MSSSAATGDQNTVGGASSSSSDSFVYLGPCDLDRYEEWASVEYGGPLLEVGNFWIFRDATLSRKRAMEQASARCRRRLEQLRLDRAGRHGPVEDRYIYDQMCSPECTESDLLRKFAMSYSGCTCLELSTQSDSPLYTMEGDWCRENSGRLLCETFDQCGIWECALGDFMCPRYEYNKYSVPHRGMGNCVESSSSAYREQSCSSSLFLLGFLLFIQVLNQLRSY